MPFRVKSTIYEESALPFLGGGSFGEVYDIGNSSAAKIYYSKPGSEQSRKLTQLFDLGNALCADPQVMQSAAMPLQPATNPNDSTLVGYSMPCFGGWARLSALRYNASQDAYQSADGYQFTDDTSVAAVFSMFATLYALARRRVTIGDISGGNILVDPGTGRPGFIDLDSAHFQDWESESLGTEGYVDPRLLEGDLNAQGGYHFDSLSDIFSLTVAAFNLTTGTMPYYFGVNPPLKIDDFLLKRLSTLRVLLDAGNCLRQHGLSLTDTTLIAFLKRRLEAIRAVKGVSGRDGEILYQHFVRVLVEDSRDNLLELLPDGDRRNPENAILGRLRTREVLDELDAKFRSRPSASIIELPLAVQQGSYQSRDPDMFSRFLSARGIDARSMVASG